MIPSVDFREDISQGPVSNRAIAPIDDFAEERNAIAQLPTNDLMLGLSLEPNFDGVVWQSDIAARRNGIGGHAIAVFFFMNLPP
jgi:hypothetical protein